MDLLDAFLEEYRTNEIQKNMDSHERHLVGLKKDPRALSIYDMRATIMDFVPEQIAKDSYTDEDGDLEVELRLLVESGRYQAHCLVAFVLEEAIQLSNKGYLERDGFRAYLRNRLNTFQTTPWKLNSNITSIPELLILELDDFKRVKQLYIDIL